jgi:pimeloyl-ACP methyl ester carboxylesterase
VKRLVIALAISWITFIGSVCLAQEKAVVEEQKTKGQFAEVNGIRMYYETHGEGEPLILLHGFFGSGTTWESYVDELAKHFRLIIPDLRGHGRSTNPAKEFTHRQAALDVYALLDELKIEKFKAMGISSGGNILLHMATQQPERADAIVLIFAMSYHSDEARENIRQWTMEEVPDKRKRDLRERHKGGSDQIHALIAQFYKIAERYDDMNFTPPYLATINARTFIVHAERDKYIPISVPVEMYRNIPTSYLWVVPNGKHAVPEGKFKTTLIEKSMEFLNGEWESDATSQ